MRKNTQPQIVMSLLRLSANMSKSSRPGHFFIRSVATAAANNGTEYALGFLRGTYYSGILVRDNTIFRSDFEKAVSYFGVKWPDFLRSEG